MRTNTYAVERYNEVQRNATIYVFHELEDGETWADFGMEQPNNLFSHLLSWPLCPLCREDTADEQRMADNLRSIAYGNGPVRRNGGN